MRDMRMIDDERAADADGQETKNELTLPIHMSLLDIAGQLNPGGPRPSRGGRGGGRGCRRRRRPSSEPARPSPSPPPLRSRPRRGREEDEWQDVGPRSAGPRSRATPAATLPPRAAAPPTPPPDIWETAEPHDQTSTYSAVGGSRGAEGAGRSRPRPRRG